jgi:hypothetical protein
MACRRAYGSVLSGNDCSAHRGDSGVGLLLSLEMLFRVGDFFLFFGCQFLDRGLRGRSSPADLAIPRAAREPYGDADVWNVREWTVRHPDPNFGR